MSKHTPGPWFVSGDYTINGYWLTIEAKDRQVCAFDGNSLEAEANARLIAAAPELLEALKACSAELLMLHTDRSGTEECIQQAYAVIAKAEGEINE